jgi:hypothetical protein
MPIINPRLAQVSKMLRDEVPVPVIIESNETINSMFVTGLEKFGIEVVGRSEVLNFAFGVVLNKDIPNLASMAGVKTIYYDEPTYKLGNMKGPIPEVRKWRPATFKVQEEQIEQVLPVQEQLQEYQEW